MKSRGFTLTELLVTIGIMTIISGATILSWGSYRSKQNLDISAQEARSLLAEALDLSLAPIHPNAQAYTVEFNKSPDDSYELSVSTGDSIKKLTAKNDVRISGYKFTKADGTVEDAGSNKLKIYFNLPKSSADFPYSKVTYFLNCSGACDASNQPNESTDLHIILDKGGEKRFIHLNTYTNVITVTK